jgi:hypothetical protein
VSALSSICQRFTRLGGRRPAAPPVDPTAAMLRPVEALVNDLAYCPTEERERLHAFLATGGRICWTCRTFTEHRPHSSTLPKGDAE